MELSELEKKRLISKLAIARTMLLCNNGFFGMLIMHLKIMLSEGFDTAATDGEKVYFSPEFLKGLSVNETIFVLHHEIMHIVFKHCARRGNRDNKIWNIAADIVVNSNILYSNGMDKNSISISSWGVSMHLAPNGKEGYRYTAEEVYDMLIEQAEKISIDSLEPWDDHSQWDMDEEVMTVWEMRIKEAYSVYTKNADQFGGQLSRELERELKQLTSYKQDWKTVLNEFIQRDVCDYSFTPPDRRFSESGFFLPDYNEAVEKIEDILFMVDTSGSIDQDALSQFYAEIQSAIEQFSERIQGQVGFFDRKVYAPQPFMSKAEFLKIKPIGGGGTSFNIIFNYVKEHMVDRNISCIVIFTDGGANFPEEDAAMGIPVLWAINNEEITPPWGKVVRI